MTRVDRAQQPEPLVRLLDPHWSAGPAACRGLLCRVEHRCPHHPISPTFR